MPDNAQEENVPTSTEIATQHLDKKSDPLNVTIKIFDDIRKIREGYTENTQPTREDLKQIQLTTQARVLEGIQAVGTSGMMELVDTINRATNQNEQSMQGMEWSIVASNQDSEHMLIVNEHRKLEFIQVNSDNAVSILSRVKEADEGEKGLTYDIRRELLMRSDGKIKTWEAYTYATSIDPSKFRQYLAEPTNWLPERQQIQQDIISIGVQEAIELSQRLDDKDPVIYALRGNSASGKTRRVRMSPVFKKAINPQTSEPDGAVNPDIYKEKLKQQEVFESKNYVSHYQTHDEGAMISKKILNRLRESDSSMIIDKRLNHQDDVYEVVEMAESSGKRVAFLDVDSDITSSAIGVLMRTPGDKEPIPPWHAIKEGQITVVRNRIDLLNQVLTSENVTYYELSGNDENRQPQVIAVKTEGQFLVIPGREQQFQNAIDGHLHESQVNNLEFTIISESSIQEFLKLYPEHMQAVVKAALETYTGLSIKDAINQHSAKLNP